MIIIKDDNNSNEQMRYEMRERMRRDSRGGYRTSTHYKDEESWKEGYEKGWKDCEKEMGGEDYRRQRDSMGRFM